MEYRQYLAGSYIPELDGIRAISVLAVIAAHMHDPSLAWLSGGRGLTWFFLLSGYLITRLCLKEETERGRVSLMAFFSRRFFRIAPLYYVVLALYCALILILGFSPEKKSGLIMALPYFLSYLQEVPTILEAHLSPIVVPFGHSWSLGIEAKFYAIWPVLAFWLLRGKANSRSVAAVLLCLVLGIAPFFDFGIVEILIYSYWNLLLGCLLGLVLENRSGFSSIRNFASSGWAFLLPLSLILLHFGIRENVDTTSMSWDTAAVRTTYSLLALGVLGSIITGNGLLKKILRVQPLIFVGKISYGIYLLHRLCVNIVEPRVERVGQMEGAIEFFLACLLSIAVASVVHFLIEKPCIELGRRWTLRNSGLKTTVPPVLVPTTREII